MNRTGQRTTLRDLEEHLQQSHVTVTGLVQRLVQKGFVEAQVDERDRRCRLLTLTPKATGTLEVIHAHLQCTEEQLVQGFTRKNGSCFSSFCSRRPKTWRPPCRPPAMGIPSDLPHRALLTDFAGAGRKFILIPFIKRR